MSTLERFTPKSPARLRHEQTLLTIQDIRDGAVVDAVRIESRTHVAAVGLTAVAYASAHEAALAQQFPYAANRLTPIGDALAVRVAQIVHG